MYTYIGLHVEKNMKKNICVCVYESESVSHSVVSNSLQPHEL